MFVRVFSSAAAGVYVLALAAPVFAAEEGAETNIFNADIGNFIFTLIIFGAVIALLGRFAWKPILTVLHERETTIRDSLESARKQREEAERKLAEYQAQLERGRAEASALVEEGRRDAEVVRRHIHEEAQQESSALLARARREIRLATDAAVKELYDRTAELSIQVASKVIQKELSPADHRRLVEESLAEMKALDRAGLN